MERVGFLHSSWIQPRSFSQKQQFYLHMVSISLPLFGVGCYGIHSPAFLACTVECVFRFLVNNVALLLCPLGALADSGDFDLFFLYMDSTP